MVGWSFFVKCKDLACPSKKALGIFVLWIKINADRCNRYFKVRDSSTASSNKISLDFDTTELHVSPSLPASHFSRNLQQNGLNTEPFRVACQHTKPMTCKEARDTEKAFQKSSRAQSRENMKLVTLFSNSAQSI